MADGIKPVHVLIGAGVALGALLLYSQAQAKPQVAPPPTPPTPPGDPTLDVARQATAAAEAAAIQSPGSRPGLIALMRQNAAAVQLQSPAAAAAYLATAAKIEAMNGGGINPNPDKLPVAPGFLAGRGDDVEVSPFVVVNAAIPIPPAAGNSLVIRVNQANATDLQGDVTAVLTPQGGISGFGNVPTQFFGRGLVTKVTRNGVPVA